MRNRNPRAMYGGAFASTLALSLLAVTAPIPSAVRFLILTGVIAGWAIAASRWSIHRFGRKAIFVSVAVPIVLLGMIGRAWWMDRPNRQMLARIEELPGIIALTNGTFLVGEIDDVYIGQKATDADVRRFTELDGLDGLKYLVVDQARISDGTAGRFGRFTSLRVLVFQGVDLSEEVLVELERELPHCRIEMLEAR